MAEKDDPFGLSNDAGRTRIRPVRSDRGQAGATARPVAPGTAQSHHDPQPVARGGPRVRHTRAHANPLVSAFAALLELAPELERADPPAEPETLRVRLYDNLIDARDAAVSAGVPLARADQAAWFVAALLDDIALNTPWGGQSGWPRQPLVTTLSGDVDAGTRFFDRLEELMRYAGRDPEMLELAYLCLGLGFRGKHRVQSGAGEAALMALRAQIARQLRDADAEGAELSPHWQGVAAPDEPRRFTVPLWTLGLAAAALITAIYMGLSIQLTTRAEGLFDLAERVPPADRAAIFRPVRDTVAPPPEIVVDTTFLELLPEFAAAAPPDRLQALRGREDAALAILAVQATAPEVFRSAKADINDVYRPLVASVARVIVENAEVIGGVTVIGHTDSVPVQRSNPFQSNQGLSEARARTIADLLIAGGVPSELVRSEGRADTEPLADNATRDGRAQNRRVEIRIEKRI
ncbi:putative lipoprotein YiaD [Defluviimonas aquaemixtae]|uniref:Putative lipoprotein YiaD n=1 Tax=Albidovulum aquaemixtae TaxID=1542388 RepID=A0A2R8B818_9RHOB|nr:type IVB secretion system protein IcmH/DotU [Defluviimonas aquaemixtae]SPH18692.1 putative lipoprotein YiaD [Defluviimonas aquaemixtae]